MQRPLLAAISLFFISFASIGADAKDDLVNSSVTKVIVFPSGAQIIREAKIDLVGGDQTIILQGLPERLIDSSLRVVGEGKLSFEIGAVDSKRILVERPVKEGVLDKTERAQLEDMIEMLKDESARLSASIKAAQTQRRLMERLAELPGQSPVRPLQETGIERSSTLLTADNWGRLFDLIGARMVIADDLIHKYGLQRRQKNKEIARLKRRLTQQPPKKDRQMEVRVAISAPEAMKAVLKIKYQIREASWRPFYDARLTTGEKGAKPQLVLARRAGIRQWSGEDWRNVKLSLSTTRPQQGAQAPVLNPKRLDLVSVHPAKPTGGYSNGFSGRVRSMARKDMGMMEDNMVAEAPAPMAAPKRRIRVRKKAYERKASIRQYAFQAVFDIPGKVTVLPSGDEKKIAISSDKIEPVLKVKTVPKLNMTAFLYANFTHDKKAPPLLPGSVSLYRDGTFTGKSSMPLVNGGDEHALGFGADDAVKVVRSEVKRTKGEEGVFTTSKIDERRYIIKVTNLHQGNIKVEVVDQIPYSVNEKVIVRLLSTSTRPSRKNLKDKRGLLAWDFTLAAGQEKQINLDYTISWPADRKLRR